MLLSVEEQLAEADRALEPIKDLMAHMRLGTGVQVNPIVVQLAVGYANSRTLLAMAMSGRPVYGELPADGPQVNQADRPLADPEGVLTHAYWKLREHASGYRSVSGVRRLRERWEASGRTDHVAGPQVKIHEFYARGIEAGARTIAELIGRPEHEIDKPATLINPDDIDSYVYVDATTGDLLRLASGDVTIVMRNAPVTIAPVDAAADLAPLAEAADVSSEVIYDTHRAYTDAAGTTGIFATRDDGETKR